MVTNSADQTARSGTGSGSHTAESPSRVTPESGAGWAGWIVFAGAVLITIGLFQVIEGFLAIFDDERIVMVANRLIGVDLTGWGWTVLISGLLMAAVGAGLLAGQTWARIVAVVVVGLHLISQVFWLGAYPLWSLLMITLDIVVLFALTARWSVASDRLDPYGSTR